MRNVDFEDIGNLIKLLLDVVSEGESRDIDIYKLKQILEQLKYLGGNAIFDIIEEIESKLR